MMSDLNCGLHIFDQNEESIFKNKGHTIIQNWPKLAYIDVYPLLVPQKYVGRNVDYIEVFRSIQCHVGVSETPAFPKRALSRSLLFQITHGNMKHKTINIELHSECVTILCDNSDH
jgi:hypothetical protein